MALHATIDAGSKADAELIAMELPGQPVATSRRGYGIIRLRLRHPRETQDILGILEACVERHRLAWARLRLGDDEWMLRGHNGSGRLH
jgi:hypothetical protein